MLSSSDLTFIKANQASALPDLGTLRTVTNVSGEGTFTETLTDEANVPYRLSFNAGSERIAGAAVTPRYCVRWPSAR